MYERKDSHAPADHKSQFFEATGWLKQVTRKYVMLKYSSTTFIFHYSNIYFLHVDIS